MVDEFNRHPNALDSHPPRLWRKLLDEELEELQEAFDAAIVSDDPHRLAALARECADVVYVTYGIAWLYALDLDYALRAVHEKAMEKMDANVRREDGKIIKPPGFVAPDMAPAVRFAQIASAAGNDGREVDTKAEATHGA